MGELNTGGVHKFRDFFSHQGCYRRFFSRKKTPRQIYASGRSDRVAAVAAAERRPTPVSHVFLPREKLTPDICGFGGALWRP